MSFSQLHNAHTVNDAVHGHKKLTPMSTVTSFYELSATLLSGKMEQFSKYEGRVTLLNELLHTYSARGLVILAFPCNQFGKLEPLENDEIRLFLQTIRPGSKFEPKFQLFAKTEVNGSNCNPIYEYLKMKQPFPLDDDGQLTRSADGFPWSPVTRYDISWNYEKFLITHDGQPVKRYTNRTKVEMLSRDIENLLRKIPKSVKERLQLQTE
ncbi:hypothetical protein KUTeg_019034 [Tegillarca granosa]|uniref:Glutathione peroxidase n=1 Tax=Tegillarca granosa TaxID=220873 RepID=A0ABQ9EHA7_TEGGR|nr:hypothetical protein KUTeg_019034 [Tegillarca granosa]